MVTFANAIQMNQQTGYQPTMQVDPVASYYAMLGIPPPMLSVGAYRPQAAAAPVPQSQPQQDAEHNFSNPNVGASPAGMFGATGPSSQTGGTGAAAYQARLADRSMGDPAWGAWIPNGKGGWNWTTSMDEWKAAQGSSGASGGANNSGTNGGAIAGVGQAAAGYMDPWEAEALRRRKAEAAAAGIPLGGGGNAGAGPAGPSPSSGIQPSYMAKLAAQVASGSPSQPQIGMAGQTGTTADDEAKRRAAKMASLAQTVAA